MNQRMKDARIQRGLSQQALADAVGVTRQTILAIEKGAYNPTIRLCIAICQQLGYTLNDLFWEPPEHPYFSEQTSWTAEQSEEEQTHESDCH